MALVEMDFASGGGSGELLFIRIDRENWNKYYAEYRSSDGTTDSTTIPNGTSSLTWRGYTFSNVVAVTVNANNKITVSRSAAFELVAFMADTISYRVFNTTTTSAECKTWGGASTITIWG